MKPAKTDPLITVSRRAMACEFAVCFKAESYPDGAELAIEALDRIEALEAQLSYFKPDSLISRINQTAVQGPVEVEPWLFSLLESAKQVFEDTKGAYDITSTPLWEAWGFARREGKVPSQAQLAEARSHVGCQFLELDRANSTVRFRIPGMKINLGSIGKGYALDECGRWLEESGMADFIVHGGRSSVLARGREDRKSAESGHHEPRRWEIGIADPNRAGRRLGVIRLEDRSLGTTAVQFQSFRYKGRRYGHVLDPRTGWPADAALSTTAVAPTAALADALSTAFHVMGPDESLEYQRSHPEVGVFMLLPGRTETEAETVAAGFAESDLELNR